MSEQTLLSLGRACDLLFWVHELKIFASLRSCECYSKLCQDSELSMPHLEEKCAGKSCWQPFLLLFFPYVVFSLSPVCGSAVPISVVMKWLAFVRTYKIINHIDQEIHSQEIHDLYSSSCLHMYGLWVLLICALCWERCPWGEASSCQGTQKEAEMRCKDSSSCSIIGLS